MSFNRLILHDNSIGGVTACPKNRQQLSLAEVAETLRSHQDGTKAS